MAHSPRTIQPGDVQDERVAGLPLAAAYTWAYLPTVLDDEGRAVDNAAVVNGRLWALRFDEHPTTAMADDLEALATEGLICRYAVDGQGYLHDPAWRRRQRLVRPVKSALPRCPVHDSGIREFVGDTITSVQDQVSSILGGAATNAGTTKVRDTVARLVEDVTFPVDPSKAASYGQRIRDFLGGAPTHDDHVDDAARFPVAGTVSTPEVEYDAHGAEVAKDPRPAADDSDDVAETPAPADAPPADESRSDEAESGEARSGEGKADEAPPAGERQQAPGEVWRAATDDPSADPGR
ncbi:hypothetical protein [Jiangella alkaliphila]|uniref:Uncharacterized protein n=1 Tax=Jiangella alkaliphila TaxID=419479 RepID=A0A1H2KDY4_9ACTN|nr:hypothetical protein [Jiangella alkaliphila]SDU66648.1 hypothetical protein SAMN04488563_3700 [Jiangella alkaliphila]